MPTGSSEPLDLAVEGIDGHAFAEALAETTQSLVCVLDREGRILLYNAACERATGFSRDEVVGRDARDFVIPHGEAEAFGDVLAGVWATGMPSPQVGHWLTRTGERRLIAWSNKPVLAEDGAPLYLVTTGLDITERERTEADLRSLEGDLEAKLHEVARLAQEQRALRRVATLVAAAAEPERIFTAVSEECARVLDVSATAVFRYDSDEAATVVGRYNRDGVPAFPLGSTIPLDGNSTISRVRATGLPQRIDDYAALPGEVARTMVEVGYRSTVTAPISVAGTIWGAVAVTSTETMPAESEPRLRDFCELVSLAVASAQARDELRASRARIVRAGDEERRRLERNLHDGAQQRLVALSLVLRLAQAHVQSDPAAAARLLDDACRDLTSALEELREIARGLHPGVLTDRGLAAALEALADRSPLPVEIAAAPDDDLPPQHATAAYYIVTEAVTNAAKHAGASCARVTVSVAGESLAVEITDDGRGGADPARGTGIVGLRDRAETLGGSLTVESPPGAGTTVRAVLPLAR